jgi:hypothetical protein
MPLSCHLTRSSWTRSTRWEKSKQRCPGHTSAVVLGQAFEVNLFGTCTFPLTMRSAAQARAFFSLSRRSFSTTRSRRAVSLEPASRDVKEALSYCSNLVRYLILLLLKQYLC